MENLSDRKVRLKLIMEAINNVKEQLNEAVSSAESISVQLEIMLRLAALRECLESELDKEAA